MSEIELDGQRYQCNKFPTRQAWHVAIKLLPGADGLWYLMSGQLNEVEDPDTRSRNGFAAIATVMREINPADADFIIDACLDNCRFLSGGQWAPLRAPGSLNGTGIMLQAADSFDVQLRLVWEVLNESMRNFSLEKLRLFQSASPSLQAVA